MTKFARLDRLPPYVFATVNQIKMEARHAGKDIIDLGMGNPDLPAPEHIVEKLVEASRKPHNHRYSASPGSGGRLSTGTSGVSMWIWIRTRRPLSPWGSKRACLT